LKILFVITRSDHGGAQVAVLDLVRHLPPGIEAVVAAGEYGFLQQQCDKLGIPFRYVPSLVQPISPFNDLRALFHLYRLIVTEEPVLVHSHTSKAGLLARLTAWIMGVPSVFTAHTWSFDEGVPHLRRHISIPMERLAARLGGKIITVSDANVQKALRHHIAREEDIVRIWNGVPDLCHRANGGLGSPLTITAVARMVPQKDFASLLEAASGLRGNWRLWLIGDGPDRACLEAQHARLRLGDRVQFLGDRLDVPELLAQSDVFVLSSHWEGLPISIIEAMRAGLPVVASNVGGVKELVAHGITGLLSRPDNSEHLRACLQALIDAPERMARMGQAGRASFECNFRIETSVSRTLEVYASVCRPLKVMPLCFQSKEAQGANRYSI
jgi:glycosyltransferase involved in cell wall biosynthesis